MGRLRDSADMDLAARVERLTAGQRACLDLVDDHATSKEIALRLGISRHTVDARLRGAMQTLGVTSRREAAIIWRAANGTGAYQPFAYQPSRLEAPADYGDFPLHDADDSQPDMPSPVAAPLALAAGEVADAAAWSFAPALAPQQEPPRTLRLWGGANDLTRVQRLAGILVVSILAMLAFGLLLSGIAALSQLRT